MHLYRQNLISTFKLLFFLLFFDKNKIKQSIQFLSSKEIHFFDVKTVIMNSLVYYNTTQIITNSWYFISILSKKELLPYFSCKHEELLSGRPLVSLPLYRYL